MESTMTHPGSQWRVRRPLTRHGTGVKVMPVPPSKRVRHIPKPTAGCMMQEPFSAKFIGKPTVTGVASKKPETGSVMKVRFALSPIELPTFYPVRQKPKSNKCLYATLICPDPPKFKAKFMSRELPVPEVASDDTSILKMASDSDFIPIQLSLQRAEHHVSRQVSQYGFDELPESPIPNDSTDSGSMDSALDQLLHTYPQAVEAAFRNLLDKTQHTNRRSGDKKRAKACVGKMSLVKPPRTTTKRDSDAGQVKVKVKLLRKVCKVYSRQVKPKKKNRLMSTIRVPTPDKRARQARHSIRPIVSQDKALEQEEDIAPLKLAKSMPSLGQKRDSSSESLISDITPHKLRRVASLSTDISRNDDSSVTTTSSTSTTFPKNGSISQSSTSCSVPSASVGLLSDSELMDVKRCSSPSRLLWM